MTTLLLTNLEFSKIGRIDSHLPNTPIMSASESFLKLTGYARNEVLGRRDRFLSGSDTDSCTLLQIDKCIQNGKPCKVRVQDCSGIVSDGLRLRISKFHILESLYQKTRRN